MPLRKWLFRRDPGAGWQPLSRKRHVDPALHHDPRAAAHDRLRDDPLAVLQTRLRADAQRDADQIRGAGDAERAKIFAAAFGKDPEFFAFYRSMQAYVTGLKASDTRFVLSPKSAFFQFFAPAAQAAPAR